MEEAFYKQLFLILTLCFFAVRVYYDYRASRQHLDKSFTARIREQIANEGLPSMVFRFVAFPVLIILVIGYPLTSWFDSLALPLPEVTRFIGAILSASSVPLLGWTQGTLGRYWSAGLEIQSDHRLITSGPYSRIRHPMYTAIMMFGVGEALLSANLLLLVLFVSASMLLALRAPVEERMLLKEFGDEYRDYMRRTGRFLPKI